MKNTLFVIVFLVSFKGVTQTYEYVPFPTGNAVWSEISAVCSNICGVYDKYFLSNEDTIINFKSYKKLYLFFDSIYNPINAIFLGGIREENKKVFYYGDNSSFNGFYNHYKPFTNSKINEIILYDFSLNIGDTITDTCYNVYGDEYFVTDIDTTIYDGKLRKVFHFNTTTYAWIEGIGHTHGLLFYLGPHWNCDCWFNELICFKQNENIVFLNNHYNDCMPQNIDENEKNELYYSIYPNPANDKLNIAIEETATIEILNIHGQIISTVHLAEKQNNINISYLPAGVYTLRIKTDRGIAMKKLIKQ